ncbi:MAG: tryptophan synthase subunit alpha [Deltaproteobacteria bacterium]|nr:tryptophan synthase subunit alpha [Deltaproteobacteria bacterium]
MSRIAETFARLQAEKRAGFIPFLMAGDPDLGVTRELLRAAFDAGADLVELGVPFSDPMADGPVLQRSAERALAAGTTLTGVLELVAEARRDSRVPIVLFGYANPFLRYGAERLARDAATSGVDGVLCVDIPPEEADDLEPALAAAGLDMIFLLAPTSDRSRVEAVRARARGFVYYVSITGTTGAAAPDSAAVAAMIDHVRARVRLPVGVGFGITEPAQAATLGRVADAVIVGSAVMRLVEEHPGAAFLPVARAFLRSLADAVHAARV